MIKKEKLFGSWKLESFTISNNGQSRDWQGGSNGLLIYADDGYMSVSINANEFKDPENSTLFYSGSYTVEGEKIHHSVTNATSERRIGENLVRDACLDGDSLKLSAEGEFGKAVLFWRKL